ncbi:MAG: hypothetical protein LIP12_12735 [Clostridiales bacterium]|nr:hypothetical protein [Clostridiales bacterium]
MKINALKEKTEKKSYDRTSATCVGRWENTIPCVFAEDLVEGGEGLCDTPYEELYEGEDGEYFIYGNHGIVTPMIFGTMDHPDELPFETEVLPLNACEAEVWAARFLTLEEFEAVCGREVSEYDKVCAAMDRDELFDWFEDIFLFEKEAMDPESHAELWSPCICRNYSGLDVDAVKTFLKNVWHLATSAG